MCKIVPLVLIISVTNVNLMLISKGSKTATLKPLSVCCDIPEIGEEKHLATCSHPKQKGPCNDIQCIFQESRFLIDKDTLNKDTYKSHLIKWAENNNGWSAAVDKAIRDCVDTEPRQHLNYPCKAYDVFSCTGIALLKKCPEIAWKC